MIMIMIMIIIMLTRDHHNTSYIWPLSRYPRRARTCAGSCALSPGPSPPPDRAPLDQAANVCACACACACAPHMRVANIPTSTEVHKDKFNLGPSNLGAASEAMPFPRPASLACDVQVPESNTRKGIARTSRRLFDSGLLLAWTNPPAASNKIIQNTLTITTIQKIHTNNHTYKQPTNPSAASWPSEDDPARGAVQAPGATHALNLRIVIFQNYYYYYYYHYL